MEAALESFIRVASSQVFIIRTEKVEEILENILGFKLKTIDFSSCVVKKFQPSAVVVETF